MRLTIQLPPWGPLMYRCGCRAMRIMDRFGASHEAKMRVARMFARVGSWRFTVTGIDLGEKKP